MRPELRSTIHTAMVRFADGDRAAFQDVFEALWPVLSAFSARMLSSRADAEDAAQRALLKVFSRIADMDRTRDGVAWAVTIAAYEVMTTRRMSARRREQGNDAMGAIPDDQPLADQQLAKDELRAAVRATIGELPPRDQEALAMMILDEAPVAGGETARKRRYRALQRFRALWGKTNG
jgi:RNA polymerase sigma factor (sigma-70 family)